MEMFHNGQELKKDLDMIILQVHHFGGFFDMLNFLMKYVIFIFLLHLFQFYI